MGRKEPGDPLTIYVPPNMKRDFKSRTALYETTMSKVLRKALEDWMMTHPDFRAKGGSDVVR
jgi:hypothetical protein